MLLPLDVLLILEACRVCHGALTPLGSWTCVQGIEKLTELDKVKLRMLPDPPKVALWC